MVNDEKKGVYGAVLMLWGVALGLMLGVVFLRANRMSHIKEIAAVYHTLLPTHKSMVRFR